jgi:hypothetical protein
MLRNADGVCTILFFCKTIICQDRLRTDKHTGKVYEESVSRRPFALSHAHAGKVKRLYLDVYASNHGGSEEFWYSSSASPQPAY